VASLPADWPTSEYLILPEALAGTPEDGVVYASFMPTLISAQSRGNVSISSSKMSDAPLINPNWLATTADQEIIIATVKRAREFAQSEAMSGVIVGEELAPGPSVQTDEELLAYIKEEFVYMSHAHSTNKMGNDSNPLAVVDTTGKVFGVNNRESSCPLTLGYLAYYLSHSTRHRLLRLPIFAAR
jgi:choline dehydrogenase